MKKILLICFILLVFLKINAQQKKVLFIGNSYTGVNNLPLLVKNIALSLGDTMFVDSNTPGGYTLNLHSTNATTQAKINSQQWDYVVLQEQSQIPSLPQSITVTDYSIPHSVTLNNKIKSNFSCTETVFYMTWGRKNGDASFCGQHPPVCTYNGMQQELRNTYMLMADTNLATVSPVGVAWKNLRDNFPLIELYNADESHPSIYGSYLAACVFYSTLYQKSTIGLTYIPSGINTSDAINIQTVASSTVLDSLDLWRINANKPIADFNYSGNGMVNFTNISTNGEFYSWDFGDGNTSTLESPTNTFSGGSNYTVELITFSIDSCFSDTISKNVNVISTEIIDEKNNYYFQISPNPATNFIKIEAHQNYTKLNLVDLSGKKIREFSNSTNPINISSLKAGVYFIQVFNKSSKLKTIKFIKN